MKNFLLIIILQIFIIDCTCQTVQDIKSIIKGFGKAMQGADMVEDIQEIQQLLTNIDQLAALTVCSDRKLDLLKKYIYENDLCGLKFRFQIIYMKKMCFAREYKIAVKAVNKLVKSINSIMDSDSGVSVEQEIMNYIKEINDLLKEMIENVKEIEQLDQEVTLLAIKDANSVVYDKTYNNSTNMKVPSLIK